jgi:hypothetical protein
VKATHGFKIVGSWRIVDRLGFVQELGVVSARVEAYTPQASPEGCLGKNLNLRED